MQVLETQRVENINYYEVLGLPLDAGAADVRRRYRELAMKNHPDVFSEPGAKKQAAENFKRVREAYDVLSDPSQRRRYDACLAKGEVFTLSRRDDSTDGPSLKEIFADVDRFEFPSGVGLKGDLADLINKNIIATDSLKEKVIEHYSVQSSDIDRSLSSDMRGQICKLEYLVLTNLRVMLALKGSTSYTVDKTKHTRTYWNASSVLLMNIERLNISYNAWKDKVFSVAFFGPDLPLSGIKIKLKGSIVPFLWLANLYDIDINIGVESFKYLKTNIFIKFVSSFIYLVAPIVILYYCIGSIQGSYHSILTTFYDVNLSLFRYAISGGVLRSRYLVVAISDIALIFSFLMAFISFRGFFMCYRRERVMSLWKTKRHK